MGPRPLDVVIVGTPRSGTTLVQRLVSDLEGVRVPPETHVLSLRGLPLLRRRSFPLDRAALSAELERYRRLPTSDGLDLDVGAVVDLLGGRCGTLWDLYAAITHVLAGDAEVVGEKTPDHLLWWRPLSTVWPDVRFVVVVRDPRAVVASNLDVPFGMRSVRLLAQRWAADDVQVEHVATALTDRCRIVRYEQVVADPDRTVDELGDFLGGRRRRTSSSGDGRAHHLSWESWKERSTGAVTTDRATAWTERLTDAEISIVERGCADRMRRHGYEPVSDCHPPPPAIADRVREARFAAVRRLRLAEIERSVRRG